MKAQTSIEFTIVLSAVAIFSVFVLGVFSNIQSAQKVAFNSLSNVPTANAPTLFDYGTGGVVIYEVASNTMYVNKSNDVQVVLSYPDGYNAMRLYLKANNGVKIDPNNYTNIAYEPVIVLDFDIVPSMIGQLNLTATIDLDTANGILTKNFTLETYSILQQVGGAAGNGTAAQGTDAFSAYVSHNSETELYSIASNTPLYTFSYSSHCAYHNFFGTLESEYLQCGAHTWGFDIQDYNCNPDTFQDEYYCFYQTPTQNTIGQLDPSPAYEYNITLRLWNGTTALHAGLLSGNTDAALIGAGNKVYGYATVNGVAGTATYPIPYLSYVLLDTPTGGAILNASNYTIYSDTRENLIDYLSSYNGSWNNGASVDLMTGTIANLNSEEAGLLNQPGAGGDYCSMSKAGANALSCNVVTPFSYDLNVYLNGSNVNQSLLYQGSLINLK